MSRTAKFNPSASAGQQQRLLAKLMKRRFPSLTLLSLYKHIENPSKSLIKIVQKKRLNLEQ